MNDKQLWVNKHSPSAIADLKGHTDANKKAIAWLNTYSTSRPVRKILLLSGPPGTGKTQLAKTLAKSTNIDCVEINCSSARSFPEIKSLIDPYISSENSTGNYSSKCIILLDELDGQATTTDKDTPSKEKNSKFFDYLSKVVMINPNPMIATCNNLYKLPSSFVEHHCELLKFNRQTITTIRNILIDIAIKEGFKISTDDIDKLIIKGDIRASISSLQIYCMSGYVIPQIERDQNIFSQTQSALTKKTTLIPLAPKKYYHDNILSYIEENGHIKAVGIDRYNFYNIIKHISNLLHDYNTEEARNLLGLISYSLTYPQPEPDAQDPYVKTITPSMSTKRSMTRTLNNTIKSLSRKLAPDYLISSTDFFEYIFPILQHQCIIDLSFARHLSLKYSLDPPEIALLIDSTASDPRINKILIPDKSLTKLTSIPDNTQSELEMFA